MGALFAALSAFGYASMALFVRLGSGRPGLDTGVLIALFVNLVLHALIVGLRSAFGVAIVLRPVGLTWLVVSGVLTSLVGRGFLYAGIERVGAARAAPIKNLAPFFTVAVAIPFLGERVGRLGAIGIGLALACYGVLLLRGGPPQPAAPVEVAPELSAEEAESADSDWSADRVGYAACTAAAACYGLGTIGRKLAVQDMPDPFLAAMISAVAGLTVYAAVMAVRGELGRAVSHAVQDRNAYFWLAGVASTAGQVCFFLGLSLTTATVVGVLTAADTLLIMVGSALFLRRVENVRPVVVVSGLGIFVATVLIVLGG